jgi:lysophospholipase L1-like esterase
MRLCRIVGPLAASLLVVGLLVWTLVAAPSRGDVATAGWFAAPTAPAVVPAHHVVLALGDSVPSGYACDCRPFPETYGSMLSTRTSAHVVVDNRAVGGLDTAGLVAQLRTADTEQAVRRSDVFLVTIGANDFGDHHREVVEGQCGKWDTDCVSDELSALRGHLAAVLATIRNLRGAQPTTVLTMGYWNVFQDGEVARRAFGEDGLQASLQLTRRANRVISSVSAAAGARYVDLYRSFEHSGRNVTSLMAPDGDHPDGAGHDLIARTLLDAGLPRMT